MNSRTAVIWIDHHEARIVDVGAGPLDEATLRSPRAHLHRHPKGGTAEHHHPDDTRRFFDDVERALEGAEQILLVGPGTAKLQFFRHLHQHARELEPKVVGIETVDHPTDNQLIAYAKRHFGIATPRIT
jgi:stalled ribosome rescue protein Dom34